MDRFIRFGLVAGVVGGLLLSFGSALSLATSAGQPLSARAATTVFALCAALEVAGAIGLLIGAGGIAAAASPGGGMFLFAAYGLSMVALALNMGWMWADLFLSDTIASVAPGVLDGTDTEVVGRLGIGMMAAWLSNLGFLLLAVAVRRTHALPRLVWIALAVAGVITLIPLPIDGAGYNLVIGLCLAAAAMASLRGGTTTLTAETDTAAAARL